MEEPFQTQEAPPSQGSQGQDYPEVEGEDANMPISGLQADTPTGLSLLNSARNPNSDICLRPEIQWLKGWEITGCYFNVVKHFFLLVLLRHI